MKFAKIQVSFTRYSDADFQQKALYIISSMTNNPNFPTPVPPLTDVQAAYDAYASALAAAAELGRKAVADKNAARDTLELTLTQLGMYVMYAANGDDTILVSSGFTLNKIPQPRVLDSPGNVTLMVGDNPGELVSLVPKKNATGFIHQISEALPTDATAWVNHNVSTGKYTFSNLTPGKQYWVRVIALGTRGQMKYSNVGTQVAGL